MRKYIYIHTVTETGGWRHGPIAGAGLQPTGQTAAVVPVIINKIWNRAATMLLRKIKLTPLVLLDVIVLHVWMRPVTVPFHYTFVIECRLNTYDAAPQNLFLFFCLSSKRKLLFLYFIFYDLLMILRKRTK